MVTFIKYVTVFFVSAAVLLECVVRAANLAGITVPSSNVSGNYIGTPGLDTIWVRGGLGELRSHIKHNAQGWNSILEYDHLPVDKQKIAVIGDSYVEGYHVDVENSIGMQLNRMLGNQAVVHEFGKSGANIIDYHHIYHDFVKGKYDHVFILVTDKDLVANKSSFMHRPEISPDNSLARKIYEKSHLLRYLNINHGIAIKISSFKSHLLDFFVHVSTPEDKDGLDKESLEIANANTKDKFDSSVVFLYEEERLDSTFIKHSPFNFVKIIHQELPKNFGFDGHWNINGRKNCATTMYNFIKTR